MFKPFKEAGFGCEVTHDPAATNTKVLLFAGQGNLWKLRAENPHTAATFLQLFDKATTAAVTLGTTIADLTVLIPAGGSADIDLSQLPLKNFALGCVYAVTATRAGSGAPGAVAGLTAWFRN
jgi:hypothetical protein